MQNLTIRQMKKEDIEFVYSICDKEPFFQISPNFHGVWSKEQLESWINSKDDVLLVAEEQDEIIGFIMIAHHKPTGKSTIENMWISNNHRKKGIAQRLFDDGLKYIKNKGSNYICAMADKENPKILNFLQKNDMDKGHSFYWMSKGI